MKMKIVLRLIVFTGFVLCSLGATAQFGLGVKYANLTSSPWITPSGYPSQGVEASAYYWFRLKDKRIEFLPEVGYAFISDPQGIDFTLNVDYAFAAFNVDFYLFDLLNDCDCPTFSKQGNFFQRSFFIEVSPGVDYQFIESYDAISNFTYDDQSLSFRIGLGIGFDIGISDLLTITPLIKYNYRTRPAWDSQYLLNEESIPEGNEWLLTAGLRVIFRPDYTRRYR